MASKKGKAKRRKKIRRKIKRELYVQKEIYNCVDTPQKIIIPETEIILKENDNNCDECIPEKGEEEFVLPSFKELEQLIIPPSYERDDIQQCIKNIQSNIDLLYSFRKRIINDTVQNRKYICDIYHKIEFVENPNSSTGYRLFAIQRKILRRRRQLKEDRAIIEELIKEISNIKNLNVVYKNSLTKTNVKIYSPRIMNYIFSDDETTKIK